MCKRQMQPDIFRDKYVVNFREAKKIMKSKCHTTNLYVDHLNYWVKVSKKAMREMLVFIEEFGMEEYHWQDEIDLNEGRLVRKGEKADILDIEKQFEITIIVNLVKEPATGKVGAWFEIKREVVFEKTEEYEDE